MVLFAFIGLLNTILELPYDLVIVIIVVVIHVFNKTLGLVRIKLLVYHRNLHGGGRKVVIKEHGERTTHIDFKDFLETKHDHEIVPVAERLAVDVIENVLE